MADTLAGLNSDYHTDYQAATAGGMSEKDFVASPTFAKYQTKLQNYYGGLTDPGEIDSQIAYHQARLDPNSSTYNPLYVSSAQGLIDSLNAAKTGLTAKKPAILPTPTPNIGAPNPPASPSPYKQTGVSSGNPGQDSAGNLVAPQDQSVESRIPGLMSTDNPIVQAAMGQATRAANARGLQNSTLATQAGVQAAETSVLPIAQQDAAQTAAQNLSVQGAAQSGALQEQSIGGTIQTTQMNIDASKENLNTQITAQNAQLAASLGSQANLQAAQIAANKLLQGQQLTAQESMLVLQLKNAMDVAGLSAATSLNISSAQLSQQRQQQAGTLAAQYASIYQTGVDNVNNNPKMSPEARAAALAGLQSQYNSNMNLVTKLYGIDLQWTNTSATPTTPTTPAP